jgi:hypothetical protein
MLLPDADFDSCYEVPPNATCSDCGADYSRAEGDPTTTCDPCSDRRDAHTTLLERRLVMAKALVKKSPLADAPKLTSAELAFCVAMLGNGWTLQRAIDKIQVQRGRLPFASGSEVA